MARIYTRVILTVGFYPDKIGGPILLSAMIHCRRRGQKCPHRSRIVVRPSWATGVSRPARAWEAMRALFAGDPERFREETAGWPPDFRDHAARVSADAFVTAPGSEVTD